MKRNADIGLFTNPSKGGMGNDAQPFPVRLNPPRGKQRGMRLLARFNRAARVEKDHGGVYIIGVGSAL